MATQPIIYKPTGKFRSSIRPAEKIGRRGWQSEGYKYSFGGGGAALPWSRSSSRSTAGQRYTPQQQSQLDFLFPDLQQRLAGVNPNQDFGQRLSSVGGTPTSFSTPPIVQAFSPEQIGQRTNTYFSNADALTAGQQRANSQQTAGRGFQSSSPILAELNQAAAGRNYRTAAGEATDFELGAAERNAGLELQSWLTRLKSEALTSEDDTRRRQLALAQQGYDVQRENALLNALNVNLRPLSFAESTSQRRSGTRGPATRVTQILG